MAIEPRARPFTVGDYYRMAEAGVLAPDERVELIEGEVIRMNPIGPPHANSVNTGNYLFVTRLGRWVTVHVQNPVRLGDLSEPEPDLTLVRKDRDTSHHPGAADVALLVEVADSSLRFDRRVKLPLYARHGIVEVWILNIGERCLEVYREPTPSGYASTGRFTEGESVAPSAFPDVTFGVDELLDQG